MTLLYRNDSRPRRLPLDIVKDLWNSVQKNIGKFQRLFGTSNMIIIDNDKFNDNTDLLKIKKEISKRLNAPITNPIGKAWINQNKQQLKNS